MLAPAKGEDQHQNANGSPEQHRQELASRESLPGDERVNEPCGDHRKADADPPELLNGGIARAPATGWPALLGRQHALQEFVPLTVMRFCGQQSLQAGARPGKVAVQVRPPGVFEEQGGGHR